jgi:hypothetical protein
MNGTQSVGRPSLPIVCKNLYSCIALHRGSRSSGKRPGPAVAATGRDLSQRRQPENGRHDHFTNAAACRLVRCTQFRYVSGGEPNG